MGWVDHEADGAAGLVVNGGLLRPVESSVNVIMWEMGEDIMSVEDEVPDQPVVPERRQKLSAAARKDLMTELAQEIGENAVIDGDAVIVEAGEPVALYCRIESDGTIVLTWWMTAPAPVGHYRWREAAAAVTGESEAIYTSALGGNFLIEVERRTESTREAARLARGTKPVERVRILAAAYPDAVVALPPEPVPEYLLPDREMT